MSKEFSMYNITSDGNIYNKKTKHKLKGSINSHGYICVRLKSSFTNKFITKTLHRLVAKEYLSSYDEKLVVNHIDGIKLHNNAKNLEMVSISENTKHAIKLNLFTPTNTHIGEKVKKEVKVTSLKTNKSTNYTSITSAMHAIGYKSIPGSWTRRKTNTVILKEYIVTLIQDTHTSIKSD